MPKSLTRLAATSSWVDSGFEAQSTRSAPPALRVRARLAVSAVTCRQADIRIPASGFSFANRSRIARSTGMSRSAHSTRFRPASASDRSLTSPCTGAAATVANSGTPLQDRESVVSGPSERRTGFPAWQAIVSGWKA